MANTGSTKLYKLLSGSVTRYEGPEDSSGVRKVVTYEANGEAGGNLVWLNEKEVAAVGLKKLEEMRGDIEGAPEQPQQVTTSGSAAGSGTTSGNPAVERVLAKKAEAKQG